MFEDFVPGIGVGFGNTGAERSREAVEDKRNCAGDELAP